MSNAAKISVGTDIGINILALIVPFCVYLYSELFKPGMKHTTIALL